MIGNILKVDIRYKHIIVGNTQGNEYVKARNLVLSYCSYAIFKMWIQFENKKLDYRTLCIRNFITKDLFSRTMYNDDKIFNLLCDKIIKEL